MEKKFILFVFGMFLISTGFAAIPTYHQFYGQTLYTNGTTAIENLSVKAYVNGSLVNDILSENGYYGYSPVYLVEGGVNGQVITFTVNNYFSTNYTFSDENTTYLDLVYNVSAPVICTDTDLDSYNGTGGATCGVLDCNDLNNAVSPGASENCGTTYDDNCDGTANEGCSTDDGDGDGDGDSGSGGTTTTPSLNFTVDTTLIEVNMTQGISVLKTFTVRNPTTTSMLINIGDPDLGMMKLSDKGFVLQPGQSRTVTVNITSQNNQALDLYIGHVLVWTSSHREEIVVSVEVVSPDSLFDIVSEIPEEYANILPGGKVVANIFLTRLAESGIQEVTITYEIQDENENIILSENEVVSVEATNTFTKEFTMPENVKLGKYVLYSKLTYADKVASATSWFNVGPRGVDNLRWFIILFVLAIAITIIVILIIRHYRVRSSSSMVVSG
jgi:hypothetical protein